MSNRKVTAAQKAEIIRGLRAAGLDSFADKVDAVPLRQMPELFSGIFQKFPQLRTAFPRLAEVFP